MSDNLIFSYIVVILGKFKSGFRRYIGNIIWF